MADEFDATAVAKKAKLLNKGFSSIPDDAAEVQAELAWEFVTSSGLQKDKWALGVRLYTAHLLWTYAFGGLSSDASNTTKVKAGELEKSSGGSISFDTSRDDPFLREWNALLKSFGKGKWSGLVVIP